MEQIRTTCCIAGGGPAGMMLGFLLARAGVDVVVLEKHADFLRDFRGDTIHPSTLEVMHELSLLDEFLKLPHRRVERLAGFVGDTPIRIADFSHLPTRCKFVALMPQWDFLDFLAGQGRRYATFDLRMRAEVTDLIEQDGRVAGVRANTPDGPLTVRSALVVGADGRHSIVRERAGLPVDDLGAPIDVFWMRLSRRPSDGADLFGRIGAGKIFVMLDRGDYWQCAFVISKGSANSVTVALGANGQIGTELAVQPARYVDQDVTRGDRQAADTGTGFDREPPVDADAAAAHRASELRDRQRLILESNVAVPAGKEDALRGDKPRDAAQCGIGGDAQGSGWPAEFHLAREPAGRAA